MIFLGTNETLPLLPTDKLKHKNFTGSELMELVAGKSAKHEAEAIAKFWDQENTNLDSSLFIEVGCKSAEIKTMMSSFFGKVRFTGKKSSAFHWLI